jgi:HK97 family phage major capsid protein
MQNQVDDSFEQACENAAAAKLGYKPRGFYLPAEAMETPPEVSLPELLRAVATYRTLTHRDLTVGTPTAGGNLVATDLLAASFIDLLRNRMMVKAMGATVLTGLVGNVEIPKQTGAATVSWVAENASGSESQQTVGQVALSPKSVTGFTDFARLLMLQSTPAIEAIVRADLAAIVALAIDQAAIHGTGASNQPLGIANQGGIGSVVGGANGAAPTWDNIVDLEGSVANANADMGRLGYLTNSKVRAKLKKTQRFAGTNGEPIWSVDQVGQAGMGVMNGNPAGVSNQVRSDLTKGTSSGVCSAIFYGNWADLLIGEWRALDVLVDPYTGATAGTVRVVVFQTVDIAVRQAASFAAMLDALTT